MPIKLLPPRVRVFSTPGLSRLIVWEAVAGTKLAPVTGYELEVQTESALKKIIAAKDKRPQNPEGAWTSFAKVKASDPLRVPMNDLSLLKKPFRIRTVGTSGSTSDWAEFVLLSSAPWDKPINACGKPYSPVSACQGH
jgi:hypothetical protein